MKKDAYEKDYLRLTAKRMHRQRMPKMLDHEGKEVPGTKGYKYGISLKCDRTERRLTCAITHLFPKPLTRYFGRAKDLPGVRELLEQQGTTHGHMKLTKALCILDIYESELLTRRTLLIGENALAAPEGPKRTRAEMHRNVDADYYGYRDEEDGVLVPLENAVEDRSTRDTHGK